MCFSSCKNLLRNLNIRTSTSPPSKFTALRDRGLETPARGGKGVMLSAGVVILTHVRNNQNIQNVRSLDFRFVKQLSCIVLRLYILTHVQHSHQPPTRPKCYTYPVHTYPVSAPCRSRQNQTCSEHVNLHLSVGAFSNPL